MTEAEALAIDIDFLRTAQSEIELARNLLVRLRSDEGQALRRALLEPTSTAHTRMAETLDAWRRRLAEIA